MFKNIFIFAIFVGLLNRIDSADSDGKQFVFSFIGTNDKLSSTATTSVIIIPSTIDSICTFKYTKNSDAKIATVQTKALFAKTNEFVLDIKEVFFLANYQQNSFLDNSSKDFRIIVSCTEDVKLIGRINDPYHGWGELFLISSLETIAGSNFILNFFPTTGNTKGVVAIHPLNFSENITVTVLGYTDGTLFSNQTFEYSTAIGVNQHYISVAVGMTNIKSDATIQILTSSQVVLTFVMPYTTKNSDPQDLSNHLNYVSFIPVPSKPYNCGTSLNEAQQIMITSDYTTEIYVSPPTVNSECDESCNITVFDYNNNVKGIQQNVDKDGMTNISLSQTTQKGFKSIQSQMSVYRLGSIIQTDGSAFGHFGHYVPSTQQWVSKTTQFYTLAKNCVLEVYADKKGSSTDFLLIDGANINTFHYKHTAMRMFNHDYSQFVINIATYGIHTIEVAKSGTYIAYVVCKAVNSPYDAAGYLVGFNNLN